MIGGRTDGRLQAIEARDRCLQAVVGARDVEEGQALWRAARKFNLRDNPDRIRLESQNPAGVSERQGGSF